MISWWHRRWILPPDTGGQEWCSKGTYRLHHVHIIRHETQNTRDTVHPARNLTNSADFIRHKIQNERNIVHLIRNWLQTPPAVLSVQCRRCRRHRELKELGTHWRKREHARRYVMNARHGFATRENMSMTDTVTGFASIECDPGKKGSRSRRQGFGS